VSFSQDTKGASSDTDDGAHVGNGTDVDVDEDYSSSDDEDGEDEFPVIHGTSSVFLPPLTA